MGLLKFVERDVAGPDFGVVQYRRGYKDRPHLSKLEMEDDTARDLGLGELLLLKYDPLGPAYLAARNLTFDNLMTVYDANNHTLVAYRFSSFDPNVKKKIVAFFARPTRPRNFEIRLFGLQNGQKNSNTNDVIYFTKSLGADVVEIDLFGDRTRHIAVDAKRGMSYDILMLDRAYKPGELQNEVTTEQFERASFQT